jgi:hypothetical protein
MVAILLLCIIPQPTGSDHYSVDLVELNHFYDENGRLVFDQVIFYDWHSIDQRFHVREWRLVKCLGHAPVRDWRNKAYVSRWSEDNGCYVVAARSFRETWTQEDPELKEREFLPKEGRTPLRSPRNLARRPPQP